MRARDIFLALWIPDIFMKRVEEDGVWSLFCPDECPELTETYGEEFEKLYLKYEKEKKYKRQIRAYELMKHIEESQIETGMPYMLYKDTANKLSNQKNVGILTGSNLCAEILIICGKDEIAVCNLASICLPNYIENGKFNYHKLAYVAGIVCRNLNKVIDINFYPSKKAEKSNKRHRPIGIGVQGFADVCCMLDIPYDSEKANEINKMIQETR